MRKPIVGGNWKSNGTVAENQVLVDALNQGEWNLKAVDVVICPTTLHIHRLQGAFKDPIKVGLQNTSATGCGAFTGEIAASQAKDFGIEWTILGHSERRRLYNDTDEVLCTKLKTAQAEGMKVIFCIGELLEERQAGQTDQVIEKQLKAAIPAISDWSRIVIAYEPVWAIGTGVVATPEQAQSAHAVTRAIIAREVSQAVADAVRIQYGGSVSPANCAELIALPDVDGFLVGGASLKPTFVDVLKAAADSYGPCKLPPGPIAPVAGPVVLLVLDGYGINKEYEGNCVFLANPENMNSYTAEAQAGNRYCQLAAHGTAVGLPDDTDMGNSEVGHNALGSGQWIAQGARLVNDYLKGPLFETQNWKDITSSAISRDSTVHLFGLLSDGGVHSHVTQLMTLLDKFAIAGVKKIRVHALTDGRDVPVDSSKVFVPMLEEKLAACSTQGRDYRVASGGGRMYCTMDRYGSDWNIVKRGWDAMVHGTIDSSIVSEIGQNGYTGFYTSMSEWHKTVVECFPGKNDQTYPPFVVTENGEPVGKIGDGDIVVNFNYRGDRAIEISQSFIWDELPAPGFERGARPNCDYYGMLIYDNDIFVPKKSLCPNPDISNVLSEYLIKSGVKMYACSETHKFGHMTFFWNGNRSGFIDQSMEKYEEVTSDPATPEQIASQPAMKCLETTACLIKAIESDEFRFLRLNYPNPDMCGHTGLIEETTRSIATMDAQLKLVVDATLAKNGAVMIMADHGNAETMIDKKGGLVTSHTTNPVPFMIVDKNATYKVCTDGIERPALTNVAATVCSLLGFEPPSVYDKTLVQPL